MRNSTKVSKRYIREGLTYFGGQLKRKIDALPEGDTIYCQLNLPEGFTNHYVELHFYKRYGSYVVRMHPDTFYTGFSRHYGNSQFISRMFYSWIELVAYCKRLPYLYT